MPKRNDSGAPRSTPRAVVRSKQPRSSTGEAGGRDAAKDGRSRVELLVELIDHCTAAKDQADGLGEKFLSYLLAMALQESRAAIRRTSLIEKPSH
jgi:hypothetical protein